MLFQPNQLTLSKSASTSRTELRFDTGGGGSGFDEGIDITTSRPLSRRSVQEEILRPVSRLSSFDDHNNSHQQDVMLPKLSLDGSSKAPALTVVDLPGSRPVSRMSVPSGGDPPKSPRLPRRAPALRGLLGGGGGRLYKSLSRASIYEDPTELLDDIDLYHTINGAASITNSRPPLPFAKIHRRTARQVAHGIPGDAFSEVIDDVGGGRGVGGGRIADCETESVFSFCEDNSWRVRKGVAFGMMYI